MLKKIRIRQYRSNYWSCSKFADWVRGVDKPYALGFVEWAGWRLMCKHRSRFRYFLAEDVLDAVQNVVMFPADLYQTLRSYIRVRWIYPTNKLPTRLPVGEWYDLDTRLLYGMFEALVDFVEIEKASMERASSARSHKKRGRDPELGLKYLDWEISLTGSADDAQARLALEVKDLYLWWKVARPSRIDTSLLDEFDVANSIEAAHDSEDTEMMIRLCKIRKGLWT